MRCIRLYLFLVASLLTVAAVSQEVKFSFLTIKDGLSQSSIKCIHQDSKGYLWFGTAHGLNKFDGFDFSIYYNNPGNPSSICGNDITCIYENPYDKTLWIGTQVNGLAAYSKERDSYISFNSSASDNSIPSDHIKDILTTKNQKLWIATSRGGICYFNPQDSIFIKPAFSSASNLQNVNCLETDQEGNLWLGTDEGLYFWSFEKQGSDSLPEKIILDQEDTSHKITALKYDFKGNLIIGTGTKGLFRYHPSTRQIDNYTSSEKKNSISSNQIRDILQTRNGDIWIATMDGLCKINLRKNDFEVFRNIPADPQSLNNDIIYSLYEDMSGIIWIGTYLGGINKIDPIQNRFPRYHFSSDLDHHKSYNDVRAVCVDDKKSTWVSTSRGLLELKTEFFTSDARKDYLVTYFEGQFTGNLIFHENVGIFISTGSGVHSIDKEGRISNMADQIEKHTGYAVRAIATSIVDTDNKIWFSAATGILEYDTESKIFKVFHCKLPDGSINPIHVLAIEEDYTGVLWLGSFDGRLFKFDKHTGVFEQIMPTPENKSIVDFRKIFSIVESSPGLIFLGTNMGLYRFDDKTSELRRFHESNGLSNDVVYSVIADDQGNLWCSTNKGVSVFNIKSENFTNYTYEDGLQSNEFNQGAYYKSKDGTIYLGGIEGLNIFHPNNVKSNAFIPPVVITGLEIQHIPVDQYTHPDIIDKQLSEINELILSHKQTTFSFEFTALSYSLPSRNRFMYILEGYDDNWIEAGNRRIAGYTQVPPGNYAFRVKGSNNDGLWNETPTAIKVDILPPFWRTLWFKTVFFTSLVVLVYLLLYLRLRSIKIQKVVLERKVEEKTIALSKQKSRIEQQNKELLKINQEIIDQSEKIQQKNQKLNEQHAQISRQRDSLLSLSEQVEEANQAKIRFFTSISHEIRTPLTLIISPLKELVGNIENMNGYQLQRKFKTIYGNASKLLLLVNQLLDFRKVETDNMELKIAKLDLVLFVQHVAFLFNEMATKKRFDFTFSSTRSKLEAWVDSEKVEKIIYNLLSNAFKYTSEGGSISISVHAEESDETSGFAIIKVKDSGYGMDEDKIPHIFERFYQLKDSPEGENSGSGLGLALTKKYIELHNGEISVESQQGKGSVFTVRIPLNLAYAENLGVTESDDKLGEFNKELIMASISDFVPVSLSVVETSDDLEKPLLLIIEDDSNLRAYLKDVLTQQFRIVDSESAEAGFELCISKNPDLIVCDVMLPGMNGIEFCQKVKSEFRISHIPVILLTALADHENHMSGIRAGADDFITKPFDLQHLILKVKNLIDQREKLQTKFRKETSLDNFDLFEGTEDKIFLKEVIECVEKNIADSAFNVDSLCSELGISQPQVYRKIKALTNLSISEFIRNIRLKKATQLLISHKFKINEVAYEVGFNDPNYFTKCFTKLFGLTPTDYVKSIGSRD